MTPELIKVPTPVIDYLNKEHETLLSHYHEYGTYSRDCASIARGIARQLLQLGEQPHLLNAEGNDGKGVVPKIFEEKIVWGQHTVCAIGGTILDPIVGKPMNAEEYRNKVFTESVNLTEGVSTKEIEWHVRVIDW